MKVGSLVNHEDYFGVGIVIDLQEIEGKTQWLIHWHRVGKTVGWSWADVDLRQSVELLCE